jgi:hypothetical protein
MDLIDEELKTGLANGPLSRHGFSEKLKKRIEERVEEQKKGPKKWMPLFSGISAAALIAAAVLLTVDWQHLFVDKAAGVNENVTAVRDQASLHTVPLGQEAVQIRSAVLIGLREDHAATGSHLSYSTYRTLLLAADQGVLRKIAEGDGIFMPYKMDFMRILPQSRSINSNEELQTLNAFLAVGGTRIPAQAPVPDKPAKLSEKLLFAGNRYLALSQTIRQKNQGKDAQYDYVWVKELPDLSPPRTQDTLTPVRDPHVSLSKLYGEAVQNPLRAVRAAAPQEPGALTASSEPVRVDENGESWAILRKQGEWVPQLASYRIGRSDPGTYRYELHDVPLKLPDSVVSHDRLSANWNEIRQVRPDAKDAFSSPNKEMLGIVTDREIVVYPLRGQLIPTPLLSLGLSPEESIVMIQWAVDEPYVKLWKQRGRLLLGE